MSSPYRREANSLCYAHTAGLPETYGWKSVSMYFSNDGVTQQVPMYVLSDTHTCSFGWLHQEKHKVTKRKARQKACQNMIPKHSKIQPGTSPDPPKSTPWEPWGPKSTQKARQTSQEMPKKAPRLVFGGFGKGPGRPTWPSWLPFGAQGFSKWKPKAQKSDVEKSVVFGVDF